MDIPCTHCDQESRKKIKFLCQKVTAPDGLPVRCVHPGTLLKLRMLEYYLSIFSTAMKDKFEHRYFLDLFAGPGLCCNRKDGAIVDGSSIRAIKLEWPFTDYIFVDLDKKTTDILSARCRATKPELMHSMRFMNQDANKSIDAILNPIIKKNSISVAFLDPNGLNIKFPTVEKLSSFPHMDLIINFSISDLRRNLRLYRASNPKANECFGSEDWPEKYSVTYYKDKLRRIGFNAVESAIEGSAKVQSLYYLIYASKHSLGLTFWKEARNRLKPDLFGN